MKVKMRRRKDTHSFHFSEMWEKWTEQVSHFINCLSVRCSQNPDKRQSTPAFITGKFWSIPEGRKLSGGRRAPEHFPSLWQISHSAGRIHWDFRFPSLPRAAAEYREISPRSECPAQAAVTPKCSHHLYLFSSKVTTREDSSWQAR